MNYKLKLCLVFITIIVIADKVLGDATTVSSADNIRILNIKKDNSIPSNPTRFHVCNKKGRMFGASHRTMTKMFHLGDIVV